MAVSTSKKVIIGIILFVYTLAVIGLTTMIVVPIANKYNPPAEEECDCSDNDKEDTEMESGGGDMSPEGR